MKNGKRPKRDRREYSARPEVKEKARAYRRAYYQRPEVKEKYRAYRRAYGQRPEVKAKNRLRAAEARKTPKFKEYHRRYEAKRRKDPKFREWQRQYWRNWKAAHRKSGPIDGLGLRGGFRLYWHRKRTIKRILALERAWSGPAYEWPYVFGGAYYVEPPADNLAELLNGNREIFVSRGNPNLGEVSAYFAAADDFVQKMAEESRDVHLAILETRAGLNACGNYVMPEPKKRRQRKEPIDQGWSRLFCPVCSQIFQIPRFALQRLREKREQFSCPNGHIGYIE